jgi:hypothetical protein
LFKIEQIHHFVHGFTSKSPFLGVFPVFKPIRAVRPPHKKGFFSKLPKLPKLPNCQFFQPFFTRRNDNRKRLEKLAVLAES